jgi:RNA polymerase-binding transcription factor DksA
MATKKTPAKAVAKKPAPKKAAPAKKAVAKPAAKPAPKKVVAKPVAKKATPAKKVAPKPVAKAALKKVVPSKKVAPAKKPVSKVVEVKKAKPVVKEVAKKVKVEKVTAPKKVTVPAKALPKKATAAKPVEKTPAPQVSVKNPQKAPPAKPEIRKPLVMPKINTKTARKYEPDFTKSVLDKAVAEKTEEIVKYSDADLAEFKELILRKLNSAKKELAYLQGLLTRKDDMGGDDGDGRYMTMEDGSLSMEREQLSQMASRQITFVDHLEKALMRIENKTYGVCRVTGKLIDKARLRAVPHATLSIEAKMGTHK